MPRCWRCLKRRLLRQQTPQQQWWQQRRSPQKQKRRRLPPPRAASRRSQNGRQRRRRRRHRRPSLSLALLLLLLPSSSHQMRNAPRSPSSRSPSPRLQATSPPPARHQLPSSWALERPPRQIRPRLPPEPPPPPPRPHAPPQCQEVERSPRTTRSIFAGRRHGHHSRQARGAGARDHRASPRRRCRHRPRPPLCPCTAAHKERRSPARMVTTVAATRLHRRATSKQHSSHAPPLLRSCLWLCRLRRLLIRGATRRHPTRLAAAAQQQHCSTCAAARSVRSGEQHHQHLLFHGEEEVEEAA